MRTLLLVKSLTPLECKEVESILAHHKRQNLLSIFRFLIKTPSSTDTPLIEEMLIKIFKQKHTRQNELQLRNKLSRLNDILYKYLAETEYKKQTNNNHTIFNYWLAQAYRSRKLPFFKNDIDSFIKTASKDFMIDEVAGMMQMRAFGKKHSFIKSINDVEDWQQIELNRFLLNYTAAEAYKVVYIENENTRLQQIQNIWSKYQSPEYRFDFKDLKNEWYFRLFENLRLAFLPENKDKSIYYLKQAEIALTGINAKHPLIYNMRAFILLNIAVALAKEKRYEEALEYQEKHLEEMNRDGSTPPSVTYVNYIAILMLVNRLAEAKQIYTEKRKVLDTGSFSKQAQLMYATACLFTNDEKNAIHLLHNIAPNIDHENLTLRNLFLISFILRKEWALATSELNNLNRAIAASKRTDYVEHIIVVTHIMKKYVLLHKKHKRIEKNKLNEINIKARETIQLLQDDPVHCCILNWLVKQTS